MDNEIKIEQLHKALSKHAIFSQLKKDNLNLMTTKGLVHDHVWIKPDSYNNHSMMVRAVSYTHLTLPTILLV